MPRKITIKIDCEVETCGSCFFHDSWVSVKGKHIHKCDWFGARLKVVRVGDLAEATRCAKCKKSEVKQ